MKTAIIIFDKFSATLIKYDRLRQKADKLLEQGNLNRKEVEIIYSALYLKSVAFFEATIENIFMGLLSKRFNTQNKKTNIKIVIKPSSFIRNALCGTSKYIDWLPYNNTEKLANIYFKDGVPFTSIEKNDKKLLDEAGYIRNALAHNSPYSLQQFHKHVIKDKELSSNERKPSGFLMALYNMKQTRYEYYVIELRRIIRNICS